MKVVTRISEVREEIRKARSKGKRVGFVPTMGFLHRGHLSLVEKSVSECGFTAVSIFVNPTQFGRNEDYGRYPRDMNRDIEMLEKGKADLVFTPSVEEMYKEGAATSVAVEKLSGVLEGKFRPGHFNGVCTVVCKLFNIFLPDRAYFGWKDAQQLIIIKRMTGDIDMPVEVIGCPTVREPDGLAASSRNIYISGNNREKALSLYRALKKIEELYRKKGIKNTASLKREGKNLIRKYPEIQIQYLEIVEPDNLTPVKKIEENVLVLGAIKLPAVRLIDNILLVA